jgi:hypothetical protein
VIENLRDRRGREWLADVDREQDTLASELHLTAYVRSKPHGKP